MLYCVKYEDNVQLVSTQGVIYNLNEDLHGHKTTWNF